MTYLIYRNSSLPASPLKRNQSNFVLSGEIIRDILYVKLYQSLTMLMELPLFQYSLYWNAYKVSLAAQM